MGKYDDIIDLKRPVSQKRLPMSMHDRAAQFSPFSALVGLDEEMDETARLTSVKIELSEDEKQDMDYVLRRAYDEKEEILITYFVRDKLKSGGEYVDCVDRIKRVLASEGEIHMACGVKIRIDDILHVEILKK